MAIDGGMLSVLNPYATPAMQNAERIPSELQQAFRNFITLAENSYPFTPMEDDKSKLANPYLEFWRLHKQHKHQLNII